MTLSTREHTVSELESLARRGRWLVLRHVAYAGAGHIGGPLSAMDMLTVLYQRILRIDPQEPGAVDRDRFILSKGHNAIALYVALAMRGYFDEAELATFDHGNSRLQGHPDMLTTPGVDASSGSLGQGLSAGVGMALGAKKSDRDFTTWVMLGDGELQEGMVWEAVQVASKYRLDNLVAVVDLNGLQQYGWDEGYVASRFDRSDPMAGFDLTAIFTGFGWKVTSVDGHDMAQVLRVFEHASTESSFGRPHVILATTTKGHGVSFTSGTYTWHNGVATEEQLRQAAEELGQEFHIAEESAS